MAKGQYTRTAAHIEHLRRAAHIRNGTLGKTPIERFMAWVNKTDGCWLWAGAVKRHGYAAFRIDGKLWRAHRFSWFLANGDIPAGMKVCHRCDTPACVNPDHLFLGTQLDNIRDMDAKGRGVRGYRKRKAHA